MKKSDDGKEETHRKTQRKRKQKKLLIDSRLDSIRLDSRRSTAGDWEKETHHTQEGVKWSQVDDWETRRVYEPLFGGVVLVVFGGWLCRTHSCQPDQSSP